jgi:DNA-directed RNA polymerase subunit RPC12/RpoP
MISTERRCPACKSHTIQKRKTSHLASEYRCGACGGDFLGIKIGFARIAWPLREMRVSERTKEA